MVTFAAACGGSKSEDSGSTRDLHDSRRDAGDMPAPPDAGAPVQEQVEDAGSAAPDSSSAPSSEPVAPPEPDAAAPVEHEPPADAGPAPCMDETCDAGAPAKLGPLWLFSAAAEGRLHNVRDREQRLVGLLGDAIPGQFGTAWNPDGSRAARLEANTLSIYSLGETAELEQTWTLDGTLGMVRWASNSRLLLQGSDEQGPLLLLVDANSGEFFPIANQVETASLIFHTGSPAGGDVLYSTPAPEGSAYSLYWLSADASEPAAELIAEYSPSPMLTPTWSDAGDLLAFGISGVPDGGLYVWNATDPAAPVRFGQEDYGYSPYYNFQPQGEQLHWLTSGAETSQLLLGDATNPAAAARILAEGQSVSPAVWSESGDYVLYEIEGASTLHATTEGALGLAITGHRYGCPLAWLDSSRFVYAACAEGGQLHQAQVSDGSLISTELDATPTAGLAAGVSNRCWVRWTEGELQVAAKDDLESRSAIAADLPSQVILAPDDSAVVWAEGNQIYINTLSDCSPSAEPTLLDAHSQDVQHLRWLPEPTKGSTDE